MVQEALYIEQVQNSLPFHPMHYVKVEETGFGISVSHIHFGYIILVILDFYFVELLFKIFYV